MAITQVKGTYHNMPVIFHQEDGKTVKITPGSFCPRCQETRYRINAKIRLMPLYPLRVDLRRGPAHLHTQGVVF